MAEASINRPGGPQGTGGQAQPTTASKRPRKKKRSRRPRGGGGADPMDAIRATAEGIVNALYQPRVEQERRNVWDAEAQHYKIDAAHDRGAAMLQGANQQVGDFSRGLQASAQQAGATQQAGMGALGGAQAQQASQQAELFGRSAKAAEVAMAEAAAAGGQLGQQGTSMQQLLGGLDLANLQRGAGLLAAGEFQRGERHRDQTIEVGQRRARLADLRAERDGQTLELAQSLFDNQQRNQIAAAGLELDWEKLGLDQQQFGFAQQQHADDVANEQRDDARADARDRRDDAFQRRDTDGDGVADVRDPAPNTPGDVRPGQYQGKSNAGAVPDGARDFGGYYDKPSGNRTRPYMAGPVGKGRKLYVSDAEYQQAVEQRSKFLTLRDRYAMAVRKGATGNDELSKVSRISDPMKLGIAHALYKKRKLTPEQLRYVKSFFPGGHLPHDLARAVESGKYQQLSKKKR